MVDVLLTHSYHLPADAKQMRKMQPYAPLGTLYAATTLQIAGISVALFDTTLHNPETEFAAVLRRQRPSIVVIYEDDFNFLSKMCLLSMRETAIRIIELARSAGATVIVHGSDATDNPRVFLDAGALFVLTGEAEQVLAELCHKLLSGEPVEDLPGVISLNSTGELECNTQAIVRNQEWYNTSHLARELIDTEPYREAWTASHGYFSSNLVASRGCPFRCNWCAKPISGNQFQLRPADAVAKEIQEMKELYGVQHLWFGDDIFALNRHWMEEFAYAVETRRCVLPYKIQSRADLMSPAVVENLRRSGCNEVWMGVESGSQKILDAMDKQLRVADVKAAAERLQSAGIRACFFLQFGYPGETWAEIQETIALVRQAKPYEIGVSLSYPLPGTVFYQRVQAEIGAKRNWRDSDDLCVMFSGAYTNDFYRILRDALHAEVTSWRPGQANHADVASLWLQVHEMEPHARTQNQQVLSVVEPKPSLVQLSAFRPAAEVA
jgi:anaerobic magnesium-protoporphyrin IX monomethyl ester cyclase